jgi:predicted ATPase
VDETTAHGGDLTVSVLRGVSARRGGEAVEVAGARLRALLALLALAPGTPRRPEYLADQLWDGEPPSANALQALVSRLRRALGSAAVVSRPTGYLLAVAPDQVDLVRFDRLVRSGEPRDARAALALAGPEPLAEFPDVPDLAEEARRVEAACLRLRGLAGQAPAEAEADAPGDTLDIAFSAPAPGDGADDPAADAAPDRSGGRRGAPAVRLIGREPLLADITDRLGRTRLVTLVGAGGAGKTSLARAIAHRAETALFAELAPVGAQAVDSEVLTAVGGRDLMLTDRARRSADQRDDRTRLLAALRDRRALLVLDNCEHVIDSAADLSAALLASCPNLTILATSREPLGVPGEARLAVGPLPVPPPHTADSRLSGYAAMELLLERGRAARPDLGDRGADGAALAEICRRLDGIPLALELAAARFSVLTPRQVADRLDDRFKLLTTGARTALPRQQTLRAVVDWSWDLLDQDERDVLCSLAVFSGGTVLEDLEAVAGREALDEVGRLTAKSLVEAAQDGGAMRYRLLETIREYALERLAAGTGGGHGAEEARDRHARHFAQLARRADRELRGPEQMSWLARLDAEEDNLRAALSWALAREDTETLLRLCAGLGWYWSLRARDHESRAAFGPAVELADRLGAGRGTDDWARTLGFHATSMFDGGLPEEVGRAMLNRALATFREVGGYHTMAMALEVGLAVFESDSVFDAIDRAAETAAAQGDDWGLATLWMLRSRLGGDDDPDLGERFALRAMELFERCGDRWGMAECGGAIGMVESLRGDHRAALSAYATGIHLTRELGAIGDETLLMVLSAAEHEYLGECAQADRLLDAATEISRRCRLSGDAAAMLAIARSDLLRRRGDLDGAEHWLVQGRDQVDRGFATPFRGWVELNTGLLAVERGRIAAAVAAFRSAIAAGTDRHLDRPEVAGTLEGLAALAARLGRPVRAAYLLGSAVAARPLLQPPTRAVDARRIERAVRELIDDDAFEAAHAEGRGLDVAAALALAHAVLDEYGAEAAEAA